MHPIVFRVFYGYLFCIGVICATLVFAAFIENALRKDTVCGYGYGYAIVVGVGVCILTGRFLMKLPRWDLIGWSFMVELWLECLGLIIVGAVGAADAGLQFCGGYQLNSIVACVAVMCLLLGVPLFLWLCFVSTMFILGSDHCFACFTCRCFTSGSSANAPQFTSESRPHEVDFVPVGNGKIGMCISPGRKKGRWDRSLDADLQRIRSNFQTDVLITLLTDQDFNDLQVHALFDSAKARGLTSIHFPIRDKFIPSDIEKFAQLIVTLVQLLRRGKTVVVHCNGGKGRTGLVVASVLIAYHALSVPEAIATVRQARPGTLYNPLQILYAYQFASYWHDNLQANTLPLVIDIEQH